MPPLFERALAFMFPHEGVDADDPDDRGGRTRYGISANRYPDEDIPNLTIDRAKYLYERDFWIGPGFDELYPSRIAIKVFDFGVNAGPARAVRVLQRALNDLAHFPPVKVDGQLGPKTLNACRDVVGWLREESLLFAFCRRQWLFYDSLATNRPSQKKFIHGWGRRAAALPD